MHKLLKTQDFYPAILGIGIFLIPIKLSFAYCIFIPLLIHFLVYGFGSRTLKEQCGRREAIPLFWMFILAIISAQVGLNPLKSTANLLAALFMSLLIPLFGIVRSRNDIMRCLIALALGQSTAALHSVIARVISLEDLPRFFVGEVTESGQLGLVILVVLGIIAELRYRAISSAWLTAHYVLLPLLVCALCINLKRGPWAGTLIAVSIYALFRSPRLLIPIATITCASLIAITPIRERILSAQEHFFIRGGRSEIWDIGKEMIETYPLGIGFKNSGVLRNFSIEIPENLKHFHSNIINITVELGFLGLGCYLWWLITIFRIALETDKRGERDFLMLALGLAIFSWQTAGLVEYNFGDSEVLYIAYALIGLLGAAQRIKSERSED
jgi:hypothetical protein